MNQHWEDPNGTKLGWEECDEKCKVEEYEKCDISKCVFPFEVGGYSYTGCTNNFFPYSSTQTFCVTNQEMFDLHCFATTPDTALLDTSFLPGWQPCSSKCPLDHKVCDECEFPFEYDGLIFDKCTTYRSDISDETKNQPVPWCKVNGSKFSYSHDIDFHWQYCSKDCVKGMYEGHHNRCNCLFNNYYNEIEKFLNVLDVTHIDDVNLIAAISTASFILLIVFIGLLIAKRRSIEPRGTNVTYETQTSSIPLEEIDLHNSDAENDNNEDTNLIPNWMTNYESMIFPQECVTKDVLLGKGQYGCVYKGKLYQGNSV